MRRHPPGPPGHWLWGNIAEVRSNVLRLLDSVPLQCGDLATLRFLGQRVLLLSHPRWFEQVLSTDNQKFEKSPRFRRLVSSVFGNGVFGAQGRDWQRQRRILQSALNGIRLDRHCDTVVATASMICDGWMSEKTASLEATMMELALAIRLRTTLGTTNPDVFDDIYRALRTFMDYFASSIRNPLSWPLWVPSESNRRIQKTMKRWWEVISEQIEAGRESADPNTLLFLLLSQELSVTYPLRDELATWLLTGTETSANTLSWTWYLLATHDEVRERLRQEVDAALQGRPPKVSDLPKLRYLNAVLKESMRLFPQAYIIGRKSTESFSMDGYSFSKGTTVLLNQWFVCRDEQWHADAREFHPERWLTVDHQSAIAFTPFGGGPRQCVGGQLAKCELPLILALLAQKFDFGLADWSWETQVRPEVSLTLRPDPRLRILLSRRGVVATKTTDEDIERNSHP
ncbi:MAG: cytochrome P450 [Planctomycetales bacterium]|nr:cytochrome P450 [Planctomycetales bacterium]